MATSPMCACGHDEFWHSVRLGTHFGCSVEGCSCQEFTAWAALADPRDALLERAVVALESIAASLAKGQS